MTLQNCTPAEWDDAIDAARSAAIPGDLPRWVTGEPLPTIATLRLEWQRAVQESLSAHRSDCVITCPPECWCWDEEAKLNAMDIETAGEPDEWACPPTDCQHCDNGWEPCDCGSEDGRHSESCAMGPCRYCVGEK